MISKENVIFFCAGSFIGAVGAIFLSKRHFQKISEEKIEKFVADFNEKMGVFSENSVEEVSEGSNSGEKNGSYGEVYDSANSGVKYGDFYSGIGENPVDLEGNSGEKSVEFVDPAERVWPSEDDEEDEELDGYSADYEDEYLDNLRDEKGVLSDELEQEAQLIHETNELNSGRKPKLISAESYDNEYNHFDKIELEYYTVDDILVDVRGEEEIHDPERIVGDCMDRFGFRENDNERVIFVRNFNHGADYEISKVFGEFYGSGF